MDGDGIPDVAVGAFFADDGASDSGSLWVLLMNSDGTVRASQEISSTQGGASYTASASGYLGYSVSHLVQS